MHWTNLLSEDMSNVWTLNNSPSPQKNGIQDYISYVSYNCQNQLKTVKKMKYCVSIDEVELRKLTLSSKGAISKHIFQEDISLT